jgi:hypothetical protein
MKRKLQIGDHVQIKHHENLSGYFRIRGFLGKTETGAQIVEVEHDMSSRQFTFGLIKQFTLSRLKLDKRHTEPT